MRGFILSFRSEFYKSRKTLGFWCAVLLPLAVCIMLVWGMYVHAYKLKALPPMMLWFSFSGAILNIMGTLLLPMYIIFVAYSVNSIEHKADTWKSLFSLPISKWSVYAAKYFYGLFLVLLCLALFCAFTLVGGNLLGMLKPELKFKDYSIASTLVQIYFKLAMAALGVLSIQFLLSLIWSDFLKPMGIGFVLMILGVIAVAADWDGTYLFPYSHAMLAIKGVSPRHNRNPFQAMQLDIHLCGKEVIVSLIVATVVFIAGYFIVERRSVK